MDITTLGTVVGIVAICYVIDQVSERLLSYIRQAKRYMACEII